MNKPVSEEMQKFSAAIAPMLADFAIRGENGKVDQEHTERAMKYALKRHLFSIGEVSNVGRAPRSTAFNDAVLNTAVAIAVRLAPRYPEGIAIGIIAYQVSRDMDCGPENGAKAMRIADSVIRGTPAVFDVVKAVKVGGGAFVKWAPGFTPEPKPIEKWDDLEAKHGANAADEPPPPVAAPPPPPPVVPALAPKPVAAPPPVAAHPPAKRR